MKRTTFLNFPHTSDCCELNEVVVERGVNLDRTDLPHWSYRLLKFPSTCKCGHPIHIAEPTQEELRDAWNLPEAESAE